MPSKNSDSFTQGQKQAQEKYATATAALLLVDNPMTPRLDRLWPGFAAFIESCPFFFISSSGKDGQCNCNFRGGGAGFVIVEDDQTLYFPDYMGNGLLHSVGDFIENPHIGMLFVNFEAELRVKVNGTVDIIDQEEDIAPFRELNKAYRNAQRVIRVNVKYAVKNCPRFLQTVANEYRHME